MSGIINNPFGNLRRTTWRVENKIKWIILRKVMNCFHKRSYIWI